MSVDILKKVVFCLDVGCIFNFSEHCIVSTLKKIAQYNCDEWMKKNCRRLTRSAILGMWIFFIIVCLRHYFMDNESVQKNTQQNIQDEIQMIFIVSTLSTMMMTTLISFCLTIVSCIILVEEYLF